MFKNGHVIVAMLVAPVLAVMSYLVVDYMVRDEPMAAQAGGNYQLVARSNCRYESGECVMENGDFQLKITARTTSPDRVELTVKAAHPLQGVQAAWLGDREQAGSPAPLTATSEDRRQWQGEVDADTLDEAIMRLAVRANDAFYFGETLARFMDYSSSYGNDFRAFRND